MPKVARRDSVDAEVSVEQLETAGKEFLHHRDYL